MGVRVDIAQLAILVNITMASPMNVHTNVYLTLNLTISLDFLFRDTLEDFWIPL